MAIDMLIRFLNVGLINVGGDDTKLEKLRETSIDLSSILKKSPSKTAPFALIAFDPEAPPDDPVIGEVVQALQKRWPTYVNTFAGTPISLIRAILLNTLIRSATEDDKIGVAFITSARNILPFIEASNERDIWADVVADIEHQVNDRAEVEWATPESISIPEMSFSVPEAIEIISPKITIDKKLLVVNMAAASGPNNAAGQPTGGNQYLPSQNQPWVNEFSSRMADVIHNTIETLVSGAQSSSIDLSSPLQELAKSVSLHVDDTLKAVSLATAGLQRRTNLIWWKESLYSPSARRSYRGMPIPTAAALMALDLFHQLPIFSPASVSAFLQEAVLSLPSIEQSKKWPIIDLVKDALNVDELMPLREASIQLVPDTLGRGPLLGILGFGPNRSPIRDGEFRVLVGIPPETLLTATEWATWIFRELQSAQAVQSGSGIKKRGRKS